MGLRTHTELVSFSQNPGWNGPTYGSRTVEGRVLEIHVHSPDSLSRAEQGALYTVRPSGSEERSSYVEIRVEIERWSAAYSAAGLQECEISPAISPMDRVSSSFYFSQRIIRFPVFWEFPASIPLFFFLRTGRPSVHFPRRVFPRFVIGETQHLLFLAPLLPQQLISPLRI